MKMEYDRETDVLYLEFRATAIEKSDELYEGIVADFDADGKVVGLEVFDASALTDHPDSVVLTASDRDMAVSAA